VLVPIIDDEGVHRFTVLAKAHQADIGNALPTTYMATARDVYEEGALIFPAVKVQQAYRDIDDIIRMCMLRIRAPEQWRGDYLASLGAARIGERELLALGAEVGWSTLEEHITEWFDYSEQRIIAAIGKLPSGRATAHVIHDPFPGTPPEGIRIEATVDVDSGGARGETGQRLHTADGAGQKNGCAVGGERQRVVVGGVVDGARKRDVVSATPTGGYIYRPAALELDITGERHRIGVAVVCATGQVYGGAGHGYRTRRLH